MTVESEVWRIYREDNMKIMREMGDNTIGSIVTDPPYGINFMNNKWDYDVPSVEFWKECLRILKPGGHILVFCGTKTQHRMAVNIEDAGFEIRDIISWLYGQGFPKSFNIANAIEGLLTTGSSNKKDFSNLNGEEKERGLGYTVNNFEAGIRPGDYSKEGSYKVNVEYSTEEAKKWEGWGTALKPACELITLARKPISEKNIALNVLKWGVGGLNIDATRIELNGEIVPINKLEDWSGFGQLEKPDYIPTENQKGRFPANLILDEEAGRMLDEQSGNSSGRYSPPKNRNRKRHFDTRGNHDGTSTAPDNYGDSGGASRFFYCPKPSKKEKDFGLDSFEEKKAGVGALRDNGRGKVSRNSHPTVKPVELMKNLIKLVTPFNEICLDPYMGSGSTIIAGKELGISCIGIEKEDEYFNIAKTRIESW